VVEADLTWVGEGFRAGVQVRVDGEGRIAEVGELGLAPTACLARRALLPGFVSAHSHAFQRGLRGRGERFPEGSGSFWSWREAMYELVGGLDPARFLHLTTQAFYELRAAGVTTVGEFHYLHHAGDGSDFALDELVLAAARAAGIRLALLETYYRTGGIGRPLEGPQLRFATPSPESFWRQVDRLAPLLDPATQSLGVAVHSIRAAAPDEISDIAAEARRRGLILHMHVEEQRREIDDCLAAYGRRPLDLLLDTLDLGPHFTAVHCTHSLPSHLERFFSTGATACICPLTEANLGDGIPSLSPPARLCLGTDSNARISLLEEMRWLEYTQRLRTESRGHLRAPDGAVSPTLLAAATTAGARSLGVAAGAIHPGLWADFAAIDLSAPSLAGWTPDTLLDTLLFGATEEVITATCVGGRWLEHR
jgi:formiminoglutamate deiminase